MQQTANAVFYSQISGHLIAVLGVTYASQYKKHYSQQRLLIGYMGHPCTSLVVFGSLVVRTGSYTLYITTTTTTSTTAHNQPRLLRPSLETQLPQILQPCHPSIDV
jgi:hypothetical protein